eukprot:25351_1
MTAIPDKSSHENIESKYTTSHSTIYHSVHTPSITTKAQSSNALENNVLLSESKQIKDLLPKHDFHHFNDRQCLVTIQKTKYRSLKLKIDIFDTYPAANDSLIIDMTSTYLPNRLMKQLRKGINKIQHTNKSKPRIFLIIKSLHDIIQHNKLTMAFDEVRKIKKMFENNTNIKLKVHETKGKIDFEMVNNDYKSRFVLHIPDLYPLAPVVFNLKTCSFPMRYQNIYTQIANNICDKLSKGFSIDYILNVRKINMKEDTTKIDLSDFNSNTALEIRQDLKTMHKMALFHTLKDSNKGMRRKVRVMNRQVKAEEEKENELRKRMERACIDPDKQQNEPVRSLLPCIEYLVKQFTDLQMELCGCCEKRIFPKNSKLLQEWEDNRKKYVNKGKYPQRCDCGHWYHHQCLQSYLSEPPFGKTCSKCKVQLKHPLFETDIKVLERQWAVQQAKKRELDDIDEFVSDLFD